MQLELTRKDCRMCGRTKPIEEYRITRYSKKNNTLTKGVPTRDTICKECESFNAKFYRMHRKLEQGKDLSEREQGLYNRMVEVYKRLNEKRPGCRLPNIVKEILSIEKQDTLDMFESLVASMEQEVIDTTTTNDFDAIVHCDNLLRYLSGIKEDAPLGYLQDLLNDVSDWDTSDWTSEYREAVQQQVKRLTALGNVVYDVNQEVGQAILDIADEVDYL